jgi:hypothetical protein
MSTSTLTKSKYDLVLPAFAGTGIAKPGHKLVDLRSLGILPGIGGGAEGTGGFNQASDLVTQTVDGFDLNDLWAEYQTAMALQNEQRSLMVQFLTFPVARNQERIPQFSQGDFEVASEYGEPRGIRPKVAQFTLGYDFEWYDLAARFTWKFLAEAPRDQIDAINAMAIEADNRLVFRKVMQALFSNVNREADIDGIQDVDVYALYNADGTVPPTYMDNVFDGTHTHYMTSGAATIVSGDLDDLYDNVAEHGYKWENGYSIVALMNSREVKVARTWRVADGDTWDFIPAQGQPGFYIPEDVRLQGQTQASNTFRGLPVVGTYGNITIIEQDLIPAGYVAVIATGGPENLNNPVGLREHENTSLRGLRLVKGPQADYPLIDSFYNRGFGTGIRQRGGAAIMQITASATYTVPAAFAA